MTSTTSTPQSHRLSQDAVMVKSSPHPNVSAIPEHRRISPADFISVREADRPASDQTPTSGSQASSYQGCDGETRTVKPAKKINVSRLAFPFNTRRKMVPPGPPSPPSPIPKRCLEPPVRCKHSCPPSPLGRVSDVPAQSPATPLGSLFKPNVRHHGHSRHSLLLTKWVWSTRQAQFEACLSDHTDEAVTPSDDALPKLLTSSPSYIRLRRMRSFYSEEKKPEQPPLTAYPRQGDIAALRDPYCARTDRSFSTVPLWTMSKILCLFVILLPPRPRQEDTFEEAGSEVSFDTESTLVDSDSEWDASTTCSSRQEDDIIDCEGQAQMSKGNLLSLAVHRANLAPDVSTSHMATAVWLCKFYLRPTFNISRDQTFPATWNARWELLIELARRDGVPKTPETRAPPPKEFRWLKLLGGSKTPKVSPVSSRVTLSFGVSPGSPGVLRSSFLTPSHPAAG